MKLFSANINISNPSAATKKMIAQEFSMLRQKKQSLTILILLFICMISWGIVAVFSTQQATKVDTDTINLAKPLNPIIDTDALSSLESKRSFTDEELSNFTIFKILVDPRTQEERIVTIDEVITPEEETP